MICSCRYENLETESPCNRPLPDTVSFSAHVVPIFISKCNDAGCHSGNNPKGKLNLEPGKAYEQLTKKEYVDIDEPSRSIIYTVLISDHEQMPPPPQTKLDDCSRKLILKWIEQKAKNN